MYTVWLWNMISYINEGMFATIIGKKDPEVNILAQVG